MFIMGSPLMAAWTAEVIKVEIVEKSPGQRLTAVTLKFTDGSTTVNDVIFESVQASTTTVSAFCKQKIAQYETLDFFKTKIPVGLVDLSVTPLSDFEKARQKFFADNALMQFLKTLVDNGVTNAQADFDNTRTAINDEYNGEYFGIKP